MASKKGISALQLMREMGFGSYKTSWYMCHRIRTALVERPTSFRDVSAADAIPKIRREVLDDLSAL